MITPARTNTGTGLLTVDADRSPPFAVEFKCTNVFGWWVASAATVEWATRENPPTTGLVSVGSAGGTIRVAGYRFEMSGVLQMGDRFLFEPEPKP